MSSPLAKYRYLPWARRGISALLKAPDAGGALPGRAKLTLGVRLAVTKDGALTTSDISAPDAYMYGPGDIVGIDPRHVIRTDPRPFTSNYEPNYLAGVEFDQPDFPWIFTPAAPHGERLRPWLALIVLKADGSEFDRPPTAPQPLPTLSLKQGRALQELSESWNFAHVQLTGDAELGATIATTPGNAISRLLCPRRLDPETSYAAFLVPAFDIGRRAGLGEDVASVATTGPAWTAASPFPLAMPYYYTFEFHTSDEGDFESLVRRLTPRDLPAEVGYRFLDVTDPAPGILSAGGPLKLEGALRSVHTGDPTWTGPEKEPFQTQLQTFVNMTSPPLDDPAAPNPEDPKVVPPLYGRWHANARTVDRTSDGWLDTLSLEPTNRSGAGMGTQVVVNDRNALLASAWNQYAGIEAANQLLRQLQLARAAMQRVYDTQLVPLAHSTLLAVTAPLHARVLDGAQTMQATVLASRVPLRMFCGAFRRTTRTLGALRRRQGVRAGDARELIDRVNDGSIEIAPAPPAPGGLVPLETLSGGALPPWLRHISRGLLFAIVAVLLCVLAAMLLVLFVVAFPLALVALVALAAALKANWAKIGALLAAINEAAEVRFDGIAAAIDATPARPGFSILPAGTSPAGSTASGADSPDAAAFRGAAARLGDAFASAPPDPPARPALDVAALRDTLLARIEPARTFEQRMTSLVKIDARLKWLPADPIEPIMAAPAFDQPMYEPLKILSEAYVLPGVELIEPETVGVLESNHRFIEAYMVGLNHEMARQLLWHRYPTDQRGSYFRQFWDVKAYVRQAGDPTDPVALHELTRDIPPIHTWPRAVPLGEHPNRTDLPQHNAVLLVRGELLKRYPNAIIYAGKAKLGTVDGKAARVLDETDERYPIFAGTLSPDITFFGFNLSIADAKGGTAASPEGFFFVFQEQFNEPRFGLEPRVKNGATTRWADLAWTDFLPGAPATTSPRLHSGYASYRQSSTVFEAVIAEIASAGAALPDFVSPATAPNVSITVAPDNAVAWNRDAAQTAYILLRLPFRVLIHADKMLS